MNQIVSPMSSAPRRSLRLRNGNLKEDEKEEPEVTVKTAPKRRSTAVNTVEKKELPKEKKQKEENEERDGDTMETEVANGETKEEDDTESDKEMDQMKTSNPTKRGEKTEKKMEVTTVSSTSRPKRRCTIAAADNVKKMASVDSQSDEDIDMDMEVKKKGRKKNESESDPESDEIALEKEVKKTVKKAPAKKKGKKVEMKEDSDDEEVEEEKPKKKETKKADTKSKEPKMQRLPSLDRVSQRVKLLLNRKYEVNRDEMLDWEKKSVHMSRELRKLENDSYASSGRQKEIMDRVNKFVERCLKDRVHEMGEQESIRMCTVLQKEFDEWERKKKMTITQRIKEKVENEKKELEAEDDSDKDEEEDEWEAMETVDGEGEVKTMQVHVENTDKNTNWKTRWLKQEVNRAMRTRYENMHKAHLLSYVAHLRHLAAMALSSTSKHGEVPMAAIALSMIPIKGKKGKKRSKERKELIEWWWKEFEESELLLQKGDEEKDSDTMGDKMEEETDKRSEEEQMSERMMERRYTSHKEAALMFFSLASSAGFAVRIVCRCRVLSKKVPEAPETKKKGAEKEPPKKKNNGPTEYPRKHSIVDYWVEMWDEETESWTPIDVVRPPIPVKKDDKEDDYEDEEEEEEVDKEIRYSEPLNSCMKKGGIVLYMLAIDYAFGIRDVSARYIHSQNFVDKEFRNRRPKPEWMNELWDMELWCAHLTRTRKEDDEWLSSMKVELPKLVGQYKDHPLYVLDKDVLKMQRIFPYNVETVGVIRGYKIYNRMYLRPTNTAKWYEKMGRQVREDEPPVGEKKLTNPMTGESIMQGLFGYWQTDPWDAGEVIEGRIPRNEFDNIYMYQPKEMCPKGGLYIVPQGLQRVALEHGKDFVPAVIGWTYKSGNIVPIMKGAVFAKEDIPELVAAWKECEKRWKEEERKIRSEKSLVAWKKLIKGMLRLAAMRKEFEPMENKKKKGTRLEDEAVRAEEAAAWPQQRYGGDLFE